MIETVEGNFVHFNLWLVMRIDSDSELPWAAATDAASDLEVTSVEEV